MASTGVPGPRTSALTLTFKFNRHKEKSRVPRLRYVVPARLDSAFLSFHDVKEPSICLVPTCEEVLKCDGVDPSGFSKHVGYG